MLRFAKLILLLLANKFKLPEFVKGSNLSSLYHWCLQAFKLVGLILGAHGTNVISERSQWLLINRSGETYLALQCIKVVSYRTEKYLYFRKLLIGIPQKMFFQKTFNILIIIIIIIIAIVRLLTVDKKMFHIIWAKRLINISQEKEKIIYLYKSVNVKNFIKTSRVIMCKVK